MFERIMVIDDQEADQWLAKHSIRSYNPNAAVYQAYDGLEALEMLKSDKCNPQLIFLDINMPRMNGFDFLEAYSKTSKEVPVLVMLTSSDQEEDRKRCAAYGIVAGYEEKPINDKLLLTLQQSIKS